MVLQWVCAASLAAAQPDRLRVEGAELLWNGEKILLHGVAVGDVWLARHSRPLSDYKTIAQDWNANVVRLGVHPTVWKNQKRAAVLAELERQTQAALEAGLFVIIEWHAIGFPDGYFQRPDPAWGSAEDLYDSNFALAKDFWSQVARKFGKEPRIIFELWNEPVFQKNDYEESVGQQWKKLKPYWQALIAIIRRHSQNLILATSNCWAYRLTGIKDDLLDDPNVAYSWHVYAGHDNDDADKWAAALDDLQKVRPVFVTEWGFERQAKAHFKGTPEGFGEKFVRDFLEAKKLHSIAWCWHADWTPSLLQKDWKTPTEFGAFVQQYLKKRSVSRP
jgi:aryl-phospho-beta-D-glucosidase BglC (GH1 family)